MVIRLRPLTIRRISLGVLGKFFISVDGSLDGAMHDAPSADGPHHPRAGSSHKVISQYHRLIYAAINKSDFAIFSC